MFRIDPPLEERPTSALIRLLVSWSYTERLLERAKKEGTPLESLTPEGITLDEIKEFIEASAKELDRRIPVGPTSEK